MSMLNALSVLRNNIKLVIDCFSPPGLARQFSEDVKTVTEYPTRAVARVSVAPTKTTTTTTTPAPGKTHRKSVWRQNKNRNWPGDSLLLCAVYSKFYSSLIDRKLIFANSWLCFALLRGKIWLVDWRWCWYAVIPINYMLLRCTVYNVTVYWPHHTIISTGTTTMSQHRQLL